MATCQKLHNAFLVDALVCYEFVESEQLHLVFVHETNAHNSRAWMLNENVNGGYGQTLYECVHVFSQEGGALPFVVVYDFGTAFRYAVKSVSKRFIFNTRELTHYFFFVLRLKAVLTSRTSICIVFVLPL